MVDGPPPSFGGTGCYQTTSTDVLFVFFLTLVVIDTGILRFLHGFYCQLTLCISNPHSYTDSSQGVFTTNDQRCEWFVEVAVSRFYHIYNMRNA